MTPLTDKDGKTCYSAADALEIARRMGEDRDQPFVLGSSCGLRTELMIGKLVTEEGIAPQALGRAYMFATENPDDPKAVAERRIMHAEQQPFGGITFPQMEAVDTGNTLQQMKNAGFSMESRDNGALALKSENKEGWTVTKDWNTGEREYIGFTMAFRDGPAKWDNHVTLSVRVHDPETNTSNFMVIDPHLQKEPKLLSFAEWKQMQNCDPAVLLVAQVGHKAELVTEPGVLRPQEEQKLSALLDAAGAKPGTLADRLNSLETVTTADEYGREKTSHPYDGIVRAMQNIPGTPKGGERIMTNFVSMKFPGLAEEPQSAPDYKAVSGDWDLMGPKEQKALTTAWVNELKPLRHLQDWCITQATKLGWSPDAKAVPTAPKQQSRSSFSSAP